MRTLITILILFSAGLLHAQVKNSSYDSVTNRALLHADTIRKKVIRTEGNIKTSIQRKEQKLDNVTRALNGAEENKTPIDSTEWKRKQEADKLKRQAEQANHKYDSMRQALKRNEPGQYAGIQAADSTVDESINKINRQANRITHVLDSADQKIVNGIHTKLSGADSEGKKVTSVEDKLLQKQQHYTDSLQAGLAKYEQKLHVDKLTHRMDSLKHIGRPFDQYQQKLDSMNNLNPLQKGQGGLTRAQSKIQSMANEPKSTIDAKLQLLATESGGKGNVPGAVNIPGADLNSVTGNITGDLKLSDGGLTRDQKLPDLKQPSLATPDASVTKDLSGLNFPKKDLDKVTDLAHGDELKKGTAEVTAVSGKVTGYTEDIKNVKEGNVDKVKTIKEDALGKLPENNELTELQKQDKLVKEQQAKLESFKHPEEYRRQTLARSNAVAAKQFAAYEKQIQASVNKVMKYNKQAGSVLAATSKMPQKRDALRKLKRYEKFVPGLTLQMQKPGAWLLDVNPSLRYRLTSYWSVGAGWSTRAVIGHYEVPARESRFYGVRGFTEVVLFKGLSLRLDAERMNAFVVPLRQTHDAGQRQWIWNYSVGVKKEFSFIPHVIGNVQFMYTVRTTSARDIYPARFNVRFGFEPLLKKKEKK